MSDVRTISNVLRTIPTFKDQDVSALDCLSERCSLWQLKPGQVLFAEGDEACEVYFLIEGQIRLTCDTGGGPEVVVGYADTGDVIGEMGIIDPAPRSASARAVDNATVVVLPGVAFMAMVTEGQSIAVDVLRVLRKSLTYRIRVLNERTQALFWMDEGCDQSPESRTSMVALLRGVWSAMRSGG